MFGYARKYRPDPSRPATGINRVYDACRAGIAGREDIHFLDKHPGGVASTAKRTFLENSMWAQSRFPRAMVLVLDIIPLYDDDFKDMRFYFKPKFDALRYYDRVLVPSKWTADTLIRDIGVEASRIEIQPLGVDQSLFRPISVDNLAWRDRYGLPWGAAIIGHASYGYTRKNMAGILEALKSIPGAILVKVGRDDLSVSLVESAGMSSRVFFLPALTDAEMVEFYNAIDVFVFPSTSEGFGLPALEAQACGCRVVTSNTTALAEILGPINCIGVDPSSPPEIAEAIQALYARWMPTPPDYGWLSDFKWKNTSNAVSRWLS